MQTLVPYQEGTCGSKQLPRRLLIAAAQSMQERCLGSVPASLTRLLGTSVPKPPAPAKSGPCCSDQPAFTLIPGSHLLCALIVLVLHTCIWLQHGQRLLACTAAQSLQACLSRSRQPGRRMQHTGYIPTCTQSESIAPIVTLAAEAGARRLHSLQHCCAL